MSTVEDLRLYFNAGYPAVVVNSPEETRVVDELRRVCQDREIALWHCSVTEGVVRMDDSNERIDAQDPMTILSSILERDTDREEWFVLLDFHPYITSNPVVARRMRDVLHRLHARSQKVVFLQPHFQIPHDLEREVTVLDLGLPSRERLGEELDSVIESAREAVAKSNNGDTYRLPEDSERPDIIEAMVGMTVLEASNALSRSFLEHGRFDLDAIGSEKMGVIKRSELMELYPSPENLSIVGGHGVVKNWLKMRHRAFSHEAREYGLKVPKGIILLGPPGTGKSLIAKCVAREWGMLLLRLDAGRLFEGVVGASEANVRRVIELCETLGRVVLWIDEVDKGFAMPSGKVLSGGEVTKHVVGSFITWLQEKTCPTFVCCTCNDHTSTPPEFLRKGRFDELFFVDLPGQTDREEITQILLRRSNRDPVNFNCAQIAVSSPGFTGAELEQAIEEAKNFAFFEEREVETDDILHAISQTTPHSKLKEKEVSDLRQWAKGRTRFSAEPAEENERKRRIKVGKSSIDF